MLAGLPSCSRDRPPGTDPSVCQPFRLGLSLQAPSAVPIIAESNGYLAGEGLVFTVADFVSGKRAMESLLKDEVDVATTADVPIAYHSFARDDFVVMATVASVENEPRIVARRSAGISLPADLRGKRVATQHASAVHFFLHMFLTKHGMDEDDVDMSFLPAEALPGALARGEVDAFSMREPYVSEARRLLGEEIVVFTEPRLYFRTEHVVARRRMAEENPHRMRALVRALLRAERFARDHPVEAAELVAKRMGVDALNIEILLRGFELRVALSQSLLNSLEDEARWMIGCGLASSPVMPNYLDFIYTAALEAERPEALTIIR